MPQANLRIGLYLLAGIVHPNISSGVYDRMERTKPMGQVAHSLFGHIPARSRLKSRKYLLTLVKLLYSPPKAVRCNVRGDQGTSCAYEWAAPMKNQLRGMTDSALDTLAGSKEQRKKWSYFNGDTACACGMTTENTAHILRCSLLSHHCTLADLLKFNDIGKECADQYKRKV